MIIVLIVIIILVIYFLIIYNLIIQKANLVKHSKSIIDVYLTQRFNLIPNLVECVKEYERYEKTIFEKIINLRTKFMKDKELSTGGVLDEEINKTIIILENYPELKASEQFLNLQKNLEKMENQIQAARRIYNNNVEDYNNLIKIFPNNILAKIFNFRSKDFFRMEQNNGNIKKIY